MKRIDKINNLKKEIEDILATINLEFLNKDLRKEYDILVEKNNSRKDLTSIVDSYERFLKKITCIKRHLV